MAPEMLDGFSGRLKNIKYNYKVDIWSLGVVLFNMLFGASQYPFGQSHSDEMMRTITELALPEYSIEKSILKGFGDDTV